MGKCMDSFNQILEQFQPLIYKTLQKLNIQQHHMDYDDFFQELQIQLLKIFDEFSGDVLNQDVDRYKFTAYAGQGLYWHGLNLIRAEDVRAYDTIEDGQLDYLHTSECGFDLASNLNIQEFFDLARVRLSDEDYELLLYLAEGKYGVQELAEVFGVSRKTIYERNKRICRRLEGIKNCLTD